MSPKRRLFNFAIDDDLAAGLKAIKARTGVSESEQVRRAIQMWLESQGEMKKAERKRAATDGLDLNRCFPGDAQDSAWERRVARKFMDLVERERPALMATLHESHKRYDPSAGHPTFGQTLVYGVEPMPAIIGRTIDRLNARFTAAEERWDPQYFPVATSSTEVIVDAIGCVGICVETWMGFEERQRIEMQKAVVELLLDDVGVRKI